MVFSSVAFLFLFLPIVLMVYYLLKVNFRNVFLMLCSLFFYYWGENYLVWIIITSTFIDYLCGLVISGGFKKGPIEYIAPEKPKTILQKTGLIISIASNLGFLGYFKYCNFFVDTFNSVLVNLGVTNGPFITISAIILPLGISFYSFQSMSYSIDVFNGKVRATRNFLDFACYVTLFPQLVAGPIVRYRDIEDQLRNHEVNIDKFSGGVFRFIMGLSKKVIIANTMAGIADSIFSIPGAELTFTTAWIGIAAYTLQIYFDFSGYSDMAIGLGSMFGFKFLENFNYPYISRSIQDFWRRWHISLSTWWRDYVYIPLGGSKKSPIRVYLNLLIVFFLCGLWHGASWNFVFWGLYQGFFLIIERLGFLKLIKKIPLFVQHAYVLVVTMVGWVFFRADSFSHSGKYVYAMVGLNQPEVANLHPPGEFLDPFSIFIICTAIILSTPIYQKVRDYFFHLSEKFDSSLFKHVFKALEIFGYSYVLVLLLFSVMSISSGTYNPFIYFRF